MMWSRFSLLSSARIPCDVLRTAIASPFGSRLVPPDRGAAMPTYILLSSLSAQGVQTLKSNPDRLREVNRDVEELGARVLHQWATLGDFDFVNVVEAPDTEIGRAHV